ncbi:Putative SOS response-associated peptidase YedK [Parageobacillus caldoxylosilyticus]|jgi:putative SOS response-associated peptidase YedK|uniref:SOS response-associated peptidase n=1 Tax=Saccharococcus caldoxylosilyticus TaxID=81408 RepID=UPI001C4DDCCD|nr:SOS response-associated peptidase [Parageobacillus caldoxylosilyticus]QXJ36995.1 Putative SOS response-associated peptidase YedK [Parageobacillus caldoxylosilyticus]
MCGRFSLTVDIVQLQALFRFVYTGTFPPRFNIAPSQEVLTVVQENGIRIGKMMKWGLVPSWANDPKIGWKMINARAETVDEKASFRHALKRRRCLILADGFYEWKKEGAKKIPYRFTLRNGEPFAFAGLWERWDKQGEPLYTCTIITTTANELVSTIHERMPVILPPERQEAWMDPRLEDSDYVKSLLQPYPAEEMKMYEVSTIVNSPKNDVMECIEPVNSE